MQHIKKYQLLIIGLLLLVITRLVFYSNLSFSDKDANVSRFQANMIYKEQLAQKYLDTLFNTAQRNELSDYVNNYNTELDWLYSEHGIVMYVWFNDRLVYWTNNELAIVSDKAWEDSGVLKIGNAIVQRELKELGEVKIASVIVLATDYPYENEYLQNRVHPSFKLNKNVKLIRNNSSIGMPVYNKDGAYVYSLLKPTSNYGKHRVFFALCIFLLALFFLFYFLRKKLRKVEFSHLQYLSFFFAVVLIRVLLQHYRLPEILYEFELFSSSHFQSTLLFPSLGELLISILIGTYLIFIYYTKTKGLGQFSNKAYWPWMYLSIRLFIVAAYAGLSIYIFNRLVNNSNIQLEAYDVLDLSPYSFVAYFLIILLFIGLVMLIDKTVMQSKSMFPFRKLWFISVLFLTIYVLVLSLFSGQIEWLSILFIVFLYSYWLYSRTFHKVGFGPLAILIIIFSLYTTTLIRNQNYDNRIELSKLMAMNLAKEQDPIVEEIINDQLELIKEDSIIQEHLVATDFHYEGLVDYMRKQYFSGYLMGYNFQLTVCNAYDSLLVDEQNEFWYPCYGFFNEILKQNGVPTSVDGLFYLKDVQGSVNYFLKIPIMLHALDAEVQMFFEINSKPNFDVLGYPKLLLQKNTVETKKNVPKNYAKYSENQLLSTSGDFPYAFDPTVYGEPINQFAYFSSEGYDHLLYKSKSNLTIIVSNPSVRFFNMLISFTYILFFFFLQVVIVLAIVNVFTPVLKIQLTIKNRIVFSMVLILLFSLILIGTGTVFYTLDQYEKHQIERMNDKSKSVLVELEHKLSDIKNLKEVSPDYLNGLLIKFSNVFYTDINLYDLQGNLVATSREQIFARQLLSRKMNAVAYRELVLNKKASIVQKEHVGTMNYYSSYVPFMGGDNKLLAYLNLPYFSKEVVLKQEILKIVVAVINVYMFLMMLSIIVAIYISNRFTAPLRMVQERFRDIDIGKQNAKIDYKGKDEIGDLVTEYNRMLGELRQSAELLAKSERETAWREMARQIAHEIKNPLTPMKLSVQLLERSMADNDPDFEERFKKVSRTLIEQIDSLSSIATAFSQFARMPVVRVEKVNLLERVKQSVELFKDHSNIAIDVTYPDKDELFVSADNERMLQIFNNLIKNARQAITATDGGEIKINFKESLTNVIVEVNDNGTGIKEEMKEKLFQPNFTTKTSGTGLGLAIVKKIVEDFGGDIWFHSTPELGTSFYISLPLFKE